MTTEPLPPTRAEFEQIKSDLHELRTQFEVAASERTRTLQLVSSIHTALMEPSPGQERSLLDRMASVTINVESGERVTTWLMRIAGVLAAIGAIFAAFKWGN